MDESFDDFDEKDLQNLLSFLSLLKQYLPKIKKKGDKSGYEIEIRSCQHNPTNCQIHMFSFAQQHFIKCFDYNNRYINNNTLLITVYFKIKNLNYLKYVQTTCDVLVTKLLKIIPKPISDSFKFFFRYVGNNIYIDFYLLNNGIVKAFLDTGINFSEYDNFYLTLNSSFIVNRLLTIYELNELYYDIFTFVFYVKTSRANIDYLFECFDTIFKNHKFDKKFEQLINGIMALYNFSGALKKFKLELDAKKIINETIRISEKRELDESFESFYKMQSDLKKMGKEISKALLSKGLLQFSQVINLDEFHIYLGVPKYKNGIAFMCNIQGLTKFVSIFINYSFLLIILEKSNLYIKNLFHSIKKNNIIIIIIIYNISNRT